MPELIVSTMDGECHILDYTAGATAMEVIHDAGIDALTALCGGVLSCATCHVHIDPEFADRLPARSEDENLMLEGIEHRDARSRLSCQIRLTPELSGLRLTVVVQE